MRLTLSHSILMLFLAVPAIQCQIFPTLDPNASPAVTRSVAAPPAVPEPTPTTDAPVKTLDVPSKDASKIADTPASGASVADEANKEAQAAAAAYILGPQDALTVRVLDMDEMGDDPYPIDLQGYVTLPRIGRVHAAGLTVEQLQVVLVQKFREYLQEPVVTVNVTEFRSQPVSILGAVATPGVHQIRGQKTLFEVISEAGGLKEAAGNTITITRQIVNGTIPLGSAVTDSSGRYSIATLNIRAVMSARNPADNIPVKPYDVITVPKADLIYVIGAVKRPGGFPLEERANMTVLEALSLAQGLDKAASTNKAKILRTDDVTHARTEVPIDVKKILDGKGTDQPLLSNDILFIPSSAAKVASYRALEALVQTGTGLAIYRP